MSRVKLGEDAGAIARHLRTIASDRRQPPDVRANADWWAGQVRRSMDRRDVLAVARLLHDLAVPGDRATVHWANYLDAQL
jgi:hypothetical protein